jgi:hypothetical protein
MNISYDILTKIFSRVLLSQYHDFGLEQTKRIGITGTLCSPRRPYPQLQPTEPGAYLVLLLWQGRI